MAPAGELPVVPTGAFPTGEFPTGEFPTGEFPAGEFPTGEFPTELATGAGETGGTFAALVPAGGEAADGAAGVGTRVIVLGTLVMIPGFWFTWGAQIPAKYERAP